MRRLAAAVLAAGVLAACNGGSDEAAEPTTSTTSTTAAPDTTAAPPTSNPPPSSTAVPASPVRLRLTKVVSLDQPVAMAVRPNDPALYFAEKTGRARRVVNGRVEGGPVLDVSDNLSQGYEQGLLGIAFSPDGRYLYANFTDRNGDTRIVEKDMQQPSAPLRELLSVDQPYANHNGGQLAFGPDGHLYIALGDGGSGNDPQANAQNLNALLGKILRISPRPAGGRPYGIPAGNPFAGQSGRRAEIWAYGLRNPWRFSFDRRTGDMWIADVGQGELEEVNLDKAPIDAGLNYEWVLREGTRRNKGERPPGGVAPVHEYSLDGANCAVTGGYAYRGTALPGYDGVYVFADFCVGRVMGLRDDGRKADDLGLEAKQLASFGEDAAGELYVLTLGGDVFRIDAA